MPLAGRVMMHHQFRNVAQPPIPGSQVDSEQFFLATDEKARFKPAGFQECSTANHGCASEKAERRRTGHGRLGR